MSKSQKRANTKRSNYINSLMQAGFTNKEARDRADGKSTQSKSNASSENIDRSYDSPWQDWASQESDF